MFQHRGIWSNINFIAENLRDLPRIIDFLFDKFDIPEIRCEIIFHARPKPEFLGTQIALSIDPKSGGQDVTYYQRIDFQFAHELSHAIQFHQGCIKLERLPLEHPAEIEARELARTIMHELLGYKNYDVTSS